MALLGGCQCLNFYCYKKDFEIDGLGFYNLNTTQNTLKRYFRVLMSGEAKGEGEFQSGLLYANESKIVISRCLDRARLNVAIRL